MRSANFIIKKSLFTIKKIHSKIMAVLIFQMHLEVLFPEGAEIAKVARKRSFLAAFVTSMVIERARVFVLL